MTITFKPNSHYATLVSNLKVLWLLLTAKYVEVKILEETFVSQPYNGYNKLLGFGGLQSKKGIRKNGQYIVFMQRGNEIWVSDEYKRINYEMHLPNHPYKLKVGDSVVLPVPIWNVLPILPHISNKTYNQTIKIQVDAYPH